MLSTTIRRKNKKGYRPITCNPFFKSLGGAEEDRTPDLRIANQKAVPLEYAHCHRILHYWDNFETLTSPK
jgi:hypothetical protein